MVICLERDADLHIAQLMPLPLTVSCFSKIQIGFTFLVPAHPGSPGQRAVKRACVTGCAAVVQIRDGRRESDRRIGRYCGSEESGLQPTTSGPAAVVMFHSDGSGGGKGFSLVYNTKRSTPPRPRPTSLTVYSYSVNLIPGCV